MSTKTQDIRKNVNTALDANTFTRTNYKFKNWSTNSDGTGNVYTDKQTVKFSNDVTLYAQWEKSIITEVSKIQIDPNDLVITNSGLRFLYKYFIGGTYDPSTQRKSLVRVNFTQQMFYNVNNSGIQFNTEDCTKYRELEKDNIPFTHEVGKGGVSCNRPFILSNSNHKLITQVSISPYYSIYVDSYIGPYSYGYNLYNTDTSKGSISTSSGKKYSVVSTGKYFNVTLTVKDTKDNTYPTFTKILETNQTNTIGNLNSKITTNLLNFDFTEELGNYGLGIGSYTTQIDVKESNVNSNTWYTSFFNGIRFYADNLN